MSKRPRNRRGTVAEPSRSVAKSIVSIPGSAVSVRRFAVGGKPLKGGRPPTNEPSQPHPVPPAAAKHAGAPPALAGPSPAGFAAGETPPTEPAELHPADELGLIRQEIRGLQYREQQLREIILAEPNDRAGELFSATVEVAWQSRVDSDWLRKNHPAIAEAATRPVRVVFVRTTRGKQ